MRYEYIFIVFVMLGKQALAVTFKEAVGHIKNHDMPKQLQHQSEKIRQEARMNGSWGDPLFKVAAKNYPEGSLDRDETPMTGIEFALSQKVALTPKYGALRGSKQAIAESTKLEAEDLERKLISSLWSMAITKRKLNSDRELLNENLTWIDKMLAVSKKLYGNGKISQQALLEVQIRKAELETELQNNSSDLKVLDQKLVYLHGQKGQMLELATVPWKRLQIIDDQLQDAKLENLKLKQVAAGKYLSAAKLNYIPDLTFSVGYTKRANIDGKGDFVSASVSLPLPFSSTKYANHNKAVQGKYQAEKALKNYKRKKERDLENLQIQISKIKAELSVLNNKTIKFASNARAITSKSYGLGRASYFELLSTELKLQSLQLRKSSLQAALDEKKVLLKYTRGEKLYE